MIGQQGLLVTLVELVDRIPVPPPPKKRPPGRPRVYTDRLFLKALVIMIVRHLHTVTEFLSVLDQPTPEMHALRLLLTERDKFPSRRTWERRLKALPDTLPAQIGCLGRHLVALIRPWANCGRAVALDSTVLRARGGVWHKKDREAAKVPHTSIDTEAHWTKSGWHGWVYGWKLHLATTVAGVWIPLAARLTPANEADNRLAASLLEELPPGEEARFVLGDTHYNAPEVRELCERQGRILVASGHGGEYPRTDAGVGVRRVFHELRSRAIENFNGQFKSIFGGQGQVPTKGLTNTARFALGAVLVYQLALLYQYEHNQELRVGLKAFLKAA
jgi:hypothetical protein